jgi:hypothetical protein
MRRRGERLAIGGLFVFTCANVYCRPQEFGRRQDSQEVDTAEEAQDDNEEPEIMDGD